MAKKTTESSEEKSIPIMDGFKAEVDTWEQSREYSDLSQLILDLLVKCERIPEKVKTFLLTKREDTHLNFFDAPASTKYHSSVLGGLAKHSLLVYQYLEKVNATLPEADQLGEESLVICGIFHDICKHGLYAPNILKSGELSHSDKAFSVKDDLPLGHGEKSIIILQQLGVQLTVQEMIMIRFHMGLWDFSYKGYESYASKAYPYHKMLQIADLWATMLEGGED